jgi:uncharacterized protein
MNNGIEATAPATSLSHADWQVLPIASRGLFVWGAALWAGFFGLGASFSSGLAMMSKVDQWWLAGVLAVLILLMFVGMGVFIGRNRWLYTRWKLDEEGLHIQRGRWWKQETLLPHSRVQHLDLERGPLERRRGLATVIIHTAGTRMQAIKVPSLLDETAVALRNAMVPRDTQMDEYVTST